MFSIDDWYEYNVLLNIFPLNTIKAGTSTHVEPIAYDGVVLLLMLLMEYRDECKCKFTDFGQGTLKQSYD